MDRGKEFACFEQVETEFGIPMYFADAYAAWQRGSKKIVMVYFESFFLRKPIWLKVTSDKLTEALVLINNRPRKCLGFKTPFDMFKHEIRN